MAKVGAFFLGFIVVFLVSFVFSKFTAGDDEADRYCTAWMIACVAFAVECARTM